MPVITIISTAGCLKSKSRKDIKLISCGIEAKLMFVFLFALTVDWSTLQNG